MATPLDLLRETSATLVAGARARGLGFGVADVAALGDDSLLRLASEAEAVRRAADAICVRLAGEITARSVREAGRVGLAARNGYRDPGAFLAKITGSTAQNAAAKGRLGVAMGGGAFAAVGDAVAAGEISLDAAEGIVTGLGPASDAPAEAVTEAVDDLLALAKDAPADDVRKVGKQWRDRLDPLRTKSREHELRDQRAFRFGRERDGLTPFSGALDPESAGWVKAYFDAQTNPRRRRVVFEDPEQIDQRNDAKAIASDGRTLDQIRLDALVGLARDGLADEQKHKTAGVRPTLIVTVTLDDLRSGLGAASILGVEEPVSASTARRLAADADIIPAVLGTAGQPLDCGVRYRVFTEHQRLMIALRDGGCAVEGCTAPPSHSEVHHLVPWEQGGPTDIANGLMLCPWHHHLLDRGWTLSRSKRTITLQPPPAAPPPPPAWDVSPPEQLQLAPPKTTPGEPRSLPKSMLSVTASGVQTESR